MKHRTLKWNVRAYMAGLAYHEYHLLITHTHTYTHTQTHTEGTKKTTDNASYQQLSSPLTEVIITFQSTQILIWMSSLSLSLSLFSFFLPQLSSIKMKGYIRRYHSPKFSNIIWHKFTVEWKLCGRATLWRNTEKSIYFGNQSPLKWLPSKETLKKL